MNIINCLPEEHGRQRIFKSQAASARSAFEFIHCTDLIYCWRKEFLESGIHLQENVVISFAVALII